MTDFYNIVVTYPTVHGQIHCRSFSVVATTPQQAWDKAVERVTRDADRPDRFDVSVSLRGHGLLHRRYNVADYILELGGK